MSTSAIYYQKSAVVQEEFKLIEMATLREMSIEKLQRVIREVKELRRECDDTAILETITLFNKARDATVDLIRSISVWQESFTSPIRPRILDCDYIIDRMIYHIDFINSTKLKRIFNFQFYRGNVLLLPYPNPKSAEPVRISTALGKEIKLFAAPPEETVVFCYQFLINCLPEDIYKDKLAPLKKWLMAGWIPRVWVMDPKPVPPAQQRRNSKKTEITAAGSRMPSMMRIDTGAQEPAPAATGEVSTPIKEAAATGAAEKVESDSDRNTSTPKGRFSRRRSSTIGSASSTGRLNISSNPNTPTHGASDNDRNASTPKGRLGRRRSTVGSASKLNASGDEGGAPRTKMKRRNQMLSDEAAQVRNIGIDTSLPTETDMQAQQQEEYEANLRRKTEREISGLDLYFKEMELLFVPALGRRAVQTVVVGGARINSDPNFNENELFHQPDKIVFTHTVRTEQDVLDEEIKTSQLVPENSNRVTVDIVAKRNRIVRDRGQSGTEQQYASFRPSGSFRPSHSAKRNPRNSSMKLDRGMSGKILIDDPDAPSTSVVTETEAEKIIRIKEALLTPGATLKKNYYPISNAKSATLDDNSSRAASASARQRTASFLSTGRRMSDVTMDTVAPPSEQSIVSAVAELPFPRPAPLTLSAPLAAAVPAAEPTPVAAAGEDTPAGETTEGADGDNTPSSRKFRQRDSRRMSDLTVTFSVHGGMEDPHADTDSVFEEVTVAPLRPFSANAQKSPKGRNSSASPQRGARITSPKRSPSPTRRAPKSPGPGTKSPGGRAKNGEGESTTGKFFSSTPTSARSSRSVVSDTNEYGIKKKVGSPPRASESLTLSTEAMRSWFASQEEVELGAIH